MPAVKFALRARRSRAGYSLIELIAVVAIVAILAALAITGYRKWLLRARTSETKDIIQGIMLAEKLYFDDTGGYLGCSSSFTAYYPGVPNDRRRPFNNPGHTDFDCWRLLAVNTDATTYMGYTVVAGPAGALPPPALTNMTVTWPVPTAPWFVVHATGDVDNNGTKSYHIGSSFQPNQILSENEDE